MSDDRRKEIEELQRLDTDELIALHDRLWILRASIADEENELTSKIAKLSSRTSMRVAEAQREIFFTPNVCAACGQASRGIVCSRGTGLGPWKRFCSDACSNRILAEARAETSAGAAQGTDHA